MKDEKIVANVFNSQADTYGFSTTVFDQFLANFERLRILEEFINTRGLILDVGTGRGRYKIELTKMGLDVVGIDISRKMLESTMIRREKESKSHLVQARALQLPFKNNTFDGVLFVRSLKYVKDCFFVLDEVSRVLRYNGKLVLYDVGNIYTFHYLYEKVYGHIIKNKKIDDPLPYYKYSVFALKRYLRNKGFKNFIVNGYVHMPRRFYKKLACENYLNAIFKVEKMIDIGLPSGLLGYSFILSATKEW